MFGRRRDRERDRYYCLPGMGRSNRRHRRRIFYSAIGFGLAVSAVVAIVLLLTYRH
jgi:hypothetical protein